MSALASRKSNRFSERPGEDLSVQKALGDLWADYCKLKQFFFIKVLFFKKLFCSSNNKLNLVLELNYTVYMVKTSNLK